MISQPALGHDFGKPTQTIDETPHEIPFLTLFIRNHRHYLAEPIAMPLIIAFVAVVDADRHILCVQFRFRDRRRGPTKNRRGGACGLESGRRDVSRGLRRLCVRRGVLGMGGGYPGDVSYTGRGLTAMTGITVPRDRLSKEVPSTTVWASKARVDADGIQFGVLRHELEGERLTLQR